MADAFDEEASADEIGVAESAILGVGKVSSEEESSWWLSVRSDDKFLSTLVLF